MSAPRWRKPCPDRLGVVATNAEIAEIIVIEPHDDRRLLLLPLLLNGWRAQLAYPKNLFLSPDVLPFTLAEIQSRLKILTTYRIDLCVADPKRNIPLWAKDAGYSPVGLDYLIERSKQDHDRRRQERTLKQGDRVAILGRGIAVVEQAGDREVDAVLWSKNVVRIDRKHIRWDDQNMRWKAEALAPNGV